jgi:SnoaL-like polyketide cyclase
MTGKELVRRLVDEVINPGNWVVLAELCTPQLEPKLRKAFTEFKPAFPDWHQETVELVEEGATVVARFRCTGTQRGAWLGITPRGGRMSIDEVYFFRISQDRLSGLWGLEDTWTRMQQLAGEDATLGELGSLG